MTIYNILIPKQTTPRFIVILTLRRRITPQAATPFPNKARKVAPAATITRTKNTSYVIPHNQQLLNSLIIETQNVRGFLRKGEWFNEFKRKGGPDILGLQETHVTSKFEAIQTSNHFNRVMGYNNHQENHYSFWSTVSIRKGGVGILINPKANITQVKPALEKYWSRRFISITFCFQNQDFLLMNIYAANTKTEREQDFQALSKIEIEKKYNLIVLGDFNCISSPVEYNISRNISKGLISLLHKWDLIDTIESLPKSSQLQTRKNHYTWGTAEQTRRLDRIYVTSNLLSGITNFNTSQSITKSDHKRVQMQFSDNPSKRRKNPTVLYPIPGNQIKVHALISIVFEVKFRS